MAVENGKQNLRESPGATLAVNAMVLQLLLDFFGGLCSHARVCCCGDEPRLRRRISPFQT
jgi:hypothetical protein